MTFELVSEASRLAGALSDVLNGSVTTGIRISAVVSQNDRGVPTRMNIGYGVTSQNQDLQKGIPLACTAKQPSLYLGYFMHLEADAESEFMMTTDSIIILSQDKDLSDELLHYDYERDKQDGYTEAHLQVCAESSAWERASVRLDGKRRPLHKLHLPVGGRRFRPSLEDVIEFLISENLVESRTGWRDVLNTSRAAFREIQLRAAIRRNPEVAADAMRQLGWAIEPPA